jgi:hypothetical protein
MDSVSDFDMLHLGAIWSDECLFDPGIEYLLIREHDRECIHLRIALECLPVDLGIDESFDGVLRGMRE